MDTPHIPELRIFEEWAKIARIHPDKKAALDAAAKNQQLDTSKLLMAQIEKLLAQEPLKPNTERAGRSPQSLVSPNFIPATARRRKALNHYAAARNIKSSEAMKLILRGWITKSRPCPKKS